MMAVMEAYFKEQGLNTIHPSTQEDMSTFLAWMRETTNYKRVFNHKNCVKRWR